MPKRKKTSEPDYAKKYKEITKKILLNCQALSEAMKAGKWEMAARISQEGAILAQLSSGITEKYLEQLSKKLEPSMNRLNNVKDELQSQNAKRNQVKLLNEENEEPLTYDQVVEIAFDVNTPDHISKEYKNILVGCKTEMEKLNLDWHRYIFVKNPDNGKLTVSID